MINTIAWDWPQYTWLIFALVSVALTASSHGQDVKINGYLRAVGFTISFLLLMAGGFFQ